MIDFTLNINESDSLVVDNELEYVLQQIDLLFNTDINEVLGDSDFGSNYDEYLYALNLSNAGLEKKIQDDLDGLNLCGYRTYVSVHIVEGTIRDIAYIDIYLDNGSNDTVKSYIIK